MPGTSSQLRDAFNRAASPTREERPAPVHLRHWQEACIEGALLGLFMISACVVTVLLQLPSSPLRQAIPDAFVRRAITGVAMGLTAIALIYSPWGQRSGAHLNPSVTLSFYRLGKIQRADAGLYVAAQFIGGAAGVLLLGFVLRDVLAQPEVRFAGTHPGAEGVWIALISEFVISFLMMWMVLHVSNHALLSRYTGVMAGLLVAAYITFEAPYSGMSMNPARSFASAVPSHLWIDLWIYFVAPPLGMLSAAEAYVRLRPHDPVKCCKLYHNPYKRCTFCGLNGDLHE